MEQLVGRVRTLAVTLSFSTNYVGFGLIYSRES